jgi:endonuclease-3
VTQQLTLISDPAPINEIARRIRQRTGSLPVYVQLVPVSQLVLSLIGARTTGEVSLEVFERLRERFRDWRDIFGISEASLQRCLQPVTYAERKAAQLRQAFRIIADGHGSLRLDFLEPWPVEDAQTWLKKLPGVGAKVSAAVLNFSTLRKRVLVVDCHHFRVAKRLGLLRRNTPFTSAQRILMNQHIPDGWTADDLDDHHSLMKRHGQTLCREHGPLCRMCPLQDICPTGWSGGYVEDRYDCPDEAYGSDERFER